MSSLCNLGHIKIILLCLLWYTISSLSNVVGKTILSQFPYPLTLTFVHILVTAILSFPLLYFSQLRSCLDCVPKSYFLTFVLPLSLGKVLTMLSGHIAIWKIPVSYAHTVKASTPIFTVLLCRLLFNERQSVPVYLSLCPIIIGVAIASVTELSFDYVGLLAGLAFTLGISLQNIFNKRLMKCTGVHSFELLSILSRVAVLLIIPVWVSLDLRKLVENRHTLNLDTDWWTVSGLLGLDGILNFIQNIIAFAFLSLVTPLTYSVANASKRILIIGVSLMILRNPVTVLNVVGMTVAISGVLFYSYFRARQHQDQKLESVEKNEVEEMEKGDTGKSEADNVRLLPGLHKVNVVGLHGSPPFEVPDLVRSSKVPVIERQTEEQLIGEFSGKSE